MLTPKRTVRVLKGEKVGNWANTCHYYSSLFIYCLFAIYMALYGGAVVVHKPKGCLS
jgi:hypothetical protein